MKIGILAGSSSDPVAHNIFFWLKSMDANPTIIYEEELFRNDSLSIDLEQEKIVLKDAKGILIDFSEFDLF